LKESTDLQTTAKVAATTTSQGHNDFVSIVSNDLIYWSDYAAVNRQYRLGETADYVVHYGKAAPRVGSMGESILD